MDRPTAAEQQAAWAEALGDDAERVRFVFVTVDPERDTAERLGLHVNAFNPEFIGLTGPQGDLDAAETGYRQAAARARRPAEALADLGGDGDLDVVAGYGPAETSEPNAWQQAGTPSTGTGCPPRPPALPLLGLVKRSGYAIGTERVLPKNRGAPLLKQ